MRTIKDIDGLRSYAARMKNHGQVIGFVPTMGALHDGHLALIEAAKKHANVVIVSIFVNPLQFGPQEDFNRYPRNLRKDSKLLENLAVDALFLPETSKLYPSAFGSFVEIPELAKKLCGRTRPLHFRGVATVVFKLCNIVTPDLLFMGEKDFQQMVIIKKMLRDLNFPTEVISHPTIRESDGLAMSSRNKFLNPKERKSAGVLYRALCLAKEEITRGERDLQKILMRMRSLIGTEPTVRLDYIVMVDPEKLEEIKQIKGHIVVALAAYVGTTRLIDNFILHVK